MTSNDPNTIEIIGCGDNSCIFGSPGGMGTNGGCRCLPESMSSGDRRDVRRWVAALRARVAELEGDLSVARLQLGARICSECPAKARVAELEAAGTELRVTGRAPMGTHARHAYYDAVYKWDQLTGVAGNKDDSRPCTCHPDDNPPRPCPRKYALSECRAASSAANKDEVRK